MEVEVTGFGDWILSEKGLSMQSQGAKSLSKDWKGL